MEFWYIYMLRNDQIRVSHMSWWLFLFDENNANHFFQVFGVFDVMMLTSSSAVY